MIRPPRWYIVRRRAITRLDHRATLLGHSKRNISDRKRLARIDEAREISIHHQGGSRYCTHLFEQKHRCVQQKHVSVMRVRILLPKVREDDNVLLHTE